MDSNYTSENGPYIGVLMFEHAFRRTLPELHVLAVATVCGDSHQVVQHTN